MRSRFYRLTGVLAAFGLLIAACGDGGTSGSTATGPDSTSPPTTTTVPVTVSPLAGQWERTEGSFTSLDGMVVEVEADGTSAVIVTVPENEFRFVAGDEKWRNIEAISGREFTVDDLEREAGSGSESLVEGVITLSDDGNTLTVNFPTTPAQEWVRVEDS